MSNSTQAESSPAFAMWVAQMARSPFAQALAFDEGADLAVDALIGCTILLAWTVMARHPEYAAALLAEEMPAGLRDDIVRFVDDGVAMHPISRNDA